MTKPDCPTCGNAGRIMAPLTPVGWDLCHAVGCQWRDEHAEEWSQSGRRAGSAEASERDDAPFVRVYDRIVRRFWVSERPITEDELRVMVEAEGLRYPGNRPIPLQIRLGETWGEFQARLARDGSQPWIPEYLREQGASES